MSDKCFCVKAGSKDEKEKIAQLIMSKATPEQQIIFSGFDIGDEWLFIDLFKRATKNNANITSQTIDNILQITVNSVEGDTTQLTKELVNYANKKGWLGGFGEINIRDKDDVYEIRLQYGQFYLYKNYKYYGKFFKTENEAKRFIAGLIKSDKSSLNGIIVNEDKALSSECSSNKNKFYVKGVKGALSKEQINKFCSDTFDGVGSNEKNIKIRELIDKGYSYLDAIKEIYPAFSEKFPELLPMVAESMEKRFNKKI